MPPSSPPPPPWWTATADGAVIAVRVQPGARRSEVQGVPGDRLRVRIAAPAIDGRANDELIRFLAVELGVRRSALTLVRGAHHRDKAVRVEGVARPPASWTAEVTA